MAITTDVLGEPWTAETIHFPPDEDGPVVATLTGVRDGQRVVIGTVETHPTP